MLHVGSVGCNLGHKLNEPRNLEAPSEFRKVFQRLLHKQEFTLVAVCVRPFHHRGAFNISKGGIQATITWNVWRTDATDAM
jgi:hypothetical protein